MSGPRGSTLALYMLSQKEQVKPDCLWVAWRPPKPAVVLAKALAWEGPSCRKGGRGLTSPGDHSLRDMPQPSGLYRAASVRCILPPPAPHGAPKRVALLGPLHSAPFLGCPPRGPFSSGEPETGCKGQG